MHPPDASGAKQDELIQGVRALGFGMLWVSKLLRWRRYLVG